MSAKRVKYAGPSGTGVDVDIPFPDGSTERIHVDQGGQLPAEVNGKSVPAAFRDSLLEQADWTDVKRSTDTKKSADSTAKTDE